VLNALDNRSSSQVPNGPTNGDGINYRDEPVAFFFVLFGIVVEALLARSAGDAEAGKEVMLRLLEILQRLLQPAISGQAVYQEAVFAETVDLFMRIVLTQDLEAQTIVVHVVKDLCLSHPSSRSADR
jgi:hypothetical protein